MRGARAGFTIFEVLAALLLLSVAMVGVVLAFATYSRRYAQQDLRMTLDQNLRQGMDMMGDTLRTAGYGVPGAPLANWITWVNGFGQNPTVVHTGGLPDAISIAGATSQAVAQLTAHVDVGGTTLSVSDASGLNVGSKGLLSIDGVENVVVRAINGTTLTVDTNPVTAGNQGLVHAYPSGTPVYRVDVITFSVSPDANGVGRLLRDANQGAGAQQVADQVTNLAISAAQKLYTITLTATSATRDPWLGFVTRRATDSVAVRN